MNRVQSYIFWQTAKTLSVIVGGLVVLAVLAQGLSQTDIIVEDRQSAAVYFKIVALSVPQVITLLLPLTLFVSVLTTLNRIHRGSEIVVAEAAGMTPWQTLSPVLRLAVVGLLIHLAVGLWAQPAAQRVMRDTLQEARGDLAASLVRAGHFTPAGENLTFYARKVSGNQLEDILISDTRDVPDAGDYIAQRGELVSLNGDPGLLLHQAIRLVKDPTGALTVFEVETYPFDLAPFLKEDTDTLLKASDRFLDELIYIDQTHYYDGRNVEPFRAEAHARLSAPLLNLILAVLATTTILGGDFSRRGYALRIFRGSVAAISILIVQLVVQTSAQNDMALNPIQWVLPLTLFSLFLIRHLRGGQFLRKRPRQTETSVHSRPSAATGEAMA